jgi:hypothetical protein
MWQRLVILDQTAHRDRGGGLDLKRFQQPIGAFDPVTDLIQLTVFFMLLCRGCIDGDD